MANSRKVIAIVQARLGSIRLPNKVMKPILGRPMIGLLLKRLSRCKNIDQIVLATSNSEEDKSLIDYVESIGFDYGLGSENNVLDRYVNVARKFDGEIVVRITGDCPLIDPFMVDECVKKFLQVGVDYLSNINPPTYPDGLDTEVFTRCALESALIESDNISDHEHVTPYIINNKKYTKYNISNKDNISDLRWTVDCQEDLDTIIKIFEYFDPNIHFSWKDVLKLYEKKPNIFDANKNIKRNDGVNVCSGQKLWKRAKKVIPGGGMLLSKRPEMFHPKKWPTYYSKAKGCNVWDLDGNEYIDMSIMGIGTNILGYGNPEVDESVRKTMELGNMSTFNCPEDVYLAERLIDLHPWSDMVRFARSGGEANAIAIRIARAAAGKEKVAICGYHGWHDWYLSANLGKNYILDGHLLPGLEPKGVPRELEGTTLTFVYNDFEGLEHLIRDHDDIGVIKMEVSRSLGPKKGFLESVRKLASEKNIILIFDECTSGFRETFGGVHKKFGVDPDMAIFGKALGNGYAISAVIGRSEIMEAAQSSFISSTFWTERIGPTAALKTLQVMERMCSWDIITAVGSKISQRWKQIADEHRLEIDIFGLTALPGFKFKSKDNLSYKTYITQEMLKKGYLAANSVYVCTEHTEQVLNDYFEALSPVFSTIADCENGQNVNDLLEGPVCHSGFNRLN